MDPKRKIAICNLEPWSDDKGQNLMGIKKVDDKLFADCWYNAPAIQRTLRMFHLITRNIENGFVSEKDLTEYDKRNDYKTIAGDLGCALYFNFRLTVGLNSQEHKAEIIQFYQDPFYQDYYRKFVEAAELDMLIVTGETGCQIINTIYPGLNLEFNGKSKRIGKLLVCSSKHPTNRDFSNKEMIDNINYFFYCYRENKE